LSQQCYEVQFIYLAVAKPLRDLITKYYWNRPPNVANWVRPCLQNACVYGVLRFFIS